MESERNEKAEELLRLTKEVFNCPAGERLIQIWKEKVLESRGWVPGHKGGEHSAYYFEGYRNFLLDLLQTLKVRDDRSE
jgi:hypothetical protein